MKTSSGKAGKNVIIFFSITRLRKLDLLCAKSRLCCTEGIVKKTEMLV